MKGKSLGTIISKGSVNTHVHEKESCLQPNIFNQNFRITLLTKKSAHFMRLDETLD